MKKIQGMKYYYRNIEGENMRNNENIDAIIYTARINIAKKFSENFKRNNRKNIKELAKLLHDREQILNGNIDVAKKYI